jgi:hypothetical protein
MRDQGKMRWQGIRGRGEEVRAEKMDMDRRLNRQAREKKGGSGVGRGGGRGEARQERDDDADLVWSSSHEICSLGLSGCCLAQTQAIYDTPHTVTACMQNLIHIVLYRPCGFRLETIFNGF